MIGLGGVNRKREIGKDGNTKKRRRERERGKAERRDDGRVAGFLNDEFN